MLETYPNRRRRPSLHLYLKSRQLIEHTLECPYPLTKVERDREERRLTYWSGNDSDTELYPVNEGGRWVGRWEILSGTVPGVRRELTTPTSTTATSTTTP